MDLKSFGLSGLRPAKLAKLDWDSCLYHFSSVPSHEPLVEFGSNCGGPCSTLRVFAMIDWLPFCAAVEWAWMFQKACIIVHTITFTFTRADSSRSKGRVKIIIGQETYWILQAKPSPRRSSWWPKIINSDSTWHLEETETCWSGTKWITFSKTTKRLPYFKSVKQTTPLLQTSLLHLSISDLAMTSPDLVGMPCISTLPT